MYKRLYRSEENRIVAGVFGGIGEYLNVDPVLVRLVGLLAILASGVVPGVIVYVVALFIIPRGPGATIVRDI